MLQRKVGEAASWCKKMQYFFPAKANAKTIASHNAKLALDCCRCIVKSSQYNHFATLAASH